MNKAIYIPIVFALSIFASCTKVIDVNIDDAPPKVVIVGSINNGEVPTIKISKTVEVDQNNSFPPVTNAVVTISDDAGNSATLQHLGDGQYSATNMLGVEGRTYNLTVTVDNKTYTASSTMPKLVVVDSLTTRRFGGFGGNTEFVVLHYTDPPQMGNYYRATLYLNDSLIPDIFIEDDKYINGNSREAVLFSGEYELVPGELAGQKINVEINCIDKNIYDYFVELIEVNGAANVASPSNPKSNISGGAVGYFSAQTSASLEKVL